MREIANVETPEENTGEVVYDEDAIIIPEDAEYTMDGTTITFTSGGDMITEAASLSCRTRPLTKRSLSRKRMGAVVVETAEPDIQEHWMRLLHPEPQQRICPDSFRQRA